jgi:TonB-linked SusC/RagA family outer membrane protein
VADYVRANVKSFDAIASLFLKIKLMRELMWETRGGLNMSYSKLNDFRPVVPTYDYYSNAFTGNLDVGATGLTVSDNSSFNPLVYSQLTYNKSFGEHSITALAGTQAEYNRTDFLTGFRKGFIGNEIRELNAGGADGQTTGGLGTEYSLMSYYGRLNYDFREKYLLEANFRYDGSSRFAENNRWGFFPSFSGGWRVSKEEFMRNVKWLSDLKLRGSWGKLGNQNIGLYPYQDILDVSSTYPLDNTGNVYNGARRTSLVDKNIKWETTRVLDIGADISVLNNKLELTADWFDKRTSDILRTAQLAAYTGLSAPTINGGVLQNRGWEMSATYRNVVGDLRYSIAGSFQTVSNKLLKYGARDISNSTTIIQEGLPYRAFYIWQWDGIFQSQDEINNSAKQPFNPKPGDLKFKDISGPNGKPDGVIDTYDRTLVDGAYAKFNYSFNLNVNYKRFDLSAFFYGVEGQKQYVQRWGFEPFTQGTAPTERWRDAWTPTNKTNSLPSMYVWGYAPITNTVSTFFLQEASFFRIKNITVGYNLPPNILKRAGISELRVFFSGDNLGVFTKYPDMDPERSPTTGQNSTFAVYPQNRILSFGARVKF